MISTEDLYYTLSQLLDQPIERIKEKYDDHENEVVRLKSAYDRLLKDISSVDDDSLPIKGISSLMEFSADQSFRNCYFKLSSL